MWPFNSSKIAIGKTVAVVDVGTDSVGCAIVILHDDERGANIQYSVRVPISLKHEPRTVERLAQRVRMAAHSAINRASTFFHLNNNSGQPISKLPIFLSAPWSSLYIRNIKSIPPENERLDKAALERMSAEYFVRQKAGENEAIIDRILCNVRLNGHRIDPSNISKQVWKIRHTKQKQLNKIEASALTVGAYRPLADMLRDETRSAFGTAYEPSFYSAAASHAQVISAIEPEREDFILCNTGGEVTGILVVRGHAPAASATMPRGSHLALQSMATHHELNREEALSTISIASYDMPLYDVFGNSLRSAENSYVKDFEKAFANISPFTGSTPVLYTLGDSPDEHWASKAITRSPMLKSIYPLGIRSSHIDRSVLAKTNAINISDGCVPDARLQLESIFCKNL